MDIYIQATCVALAFAVSENFGYGLVYGVDVLVGRSVLATIGHLFLTVIVGSGYGYYRFYGRTEKKLMRIGVMAFAFFLSSILHGLYNFTILSTDNPGYSALIDFIAFVIAALAIYSAISKSGYRAYRFKEHGIAIPRIREALKTNRKSTVLRKRLAIYLLAAGKYSEAADILTDLYHSNSKDIVVQYFMAPALWFCGETAEAIEIIDDIVMKIPKLKRQKLERIVRRILISEPEKWGYLDKYHAAEFVGDLRE